MLVNGKKCGQIKLKIMSFDQIFGIEGLTFSIVVY